MTPDAGSILAAHGRTVEAGLRAVVQRQRDAGAPARIVDAVAYSLLDGGKRLRPALVLETARALATTRTPAASLPTSDFPLPTSTPLAAACAIELIHTFSLVHDDLPAMDDDALRRGRPTNHVVYGEATAVLAGDAMVALAFATLAADADADLVPALALELATATGPAGMIGGQQLDIDAERGAAPATTADDLRRIHRLKTGALLRCACRLGATAARADAAALAAVTAYAEHLGLAFQIVDDLLDVTATPESMGKATNKDAARGKATYPGLLGVDEARRQADAELAAALDALSPLGESADGLRALARFVVERER